MKQVFPKFISPQAEENVCESLRPNTEGYTDPEAVFDLLLLMGAGSRVFGTAYPCELNESAARMVDMVGEEL